MIHFTLAVTGTVDHHAGAAHAAHAAGTTGSVTRIVGIINHIHRARTQIRFFGDDVVADFMHLAFELPGPTFLFHRPKKVSEVLVLVAHIPTLVGEFLIREIDPGKLFFEFLGVEFPCGFDGRSGEDHGVG